MSGYDADARPPTVERGTGRTGRPVRLDPVPRPVRRRNLSRAIADALAEEIARGRLKPGERLPSERDLSDAFAVGRSSVREAIKTLESRGLVEGRQGEGTFVRSLSLAALVQVPPVPVSVGETEVRRLFEVRTLLEPGIARLAAERVTNADIVALRRLLERQERLIAGGRYGSEDDARFHLRIARITGNPVFTRLLDGVMRLLADVREPALRAATTAGRRVNLAGHWEILGALEARDPVRAATCALRHLDGAEATALQILREQAPSRD